VGDALPGVVLRADEPGYADATRPWNGMVDKRPAVVVQPGSAVEVAAAVRNATERGFPLSVRGGGHHIAGTSLVDGGLTIDLSRLTAIDVDPDARTATVGAGCRLRDVDRET
jgi:FAD/FMN-containing dehydrogenase